MDFSDMLEMDRAYYDDCGPGDPGRPYWALDRVRPPRELTEALRERYPFHRLFEVPRGWRRAFGLWMLEDLRTVLLAMGGDEMLHDYRVWDVKEKYGELVWSAGLSSGAGWLDPAGNPGPAGWLLNVSEFYCAASEHICIRCGGVEDVRQSIGWINPVCSCDDRWEDGAALRRPARDEPFGIWWEDLHDKHNRKDMVVGADAPIVAELGLPAPLHATELWNRLAV